MRRPAPIAALALLAGATVAGVTMAGTTTASAQATTLTVATFAPPQHGMSKWIEAWAAGLEQASDGRLDIEILHGGQMGPPPKYYDLARNGQADITWILHGATPGRFDLVEVANMPYIFCSAEQADLVLNDPAVRDAYLEPEHRGVKLLTLFAHPPGQIAMAKGRVETADDLAGKAMRPASSAVGGFIAALGARPVGLPPTEMAEALQKGTLDGTFIDYGGAAFAYQLAPYLESVSEVGAYASSFALVMNERAFEALPEDLRALIDDSFADKAAEIGAVWDGLDEAGKNVLAGEGVEIVTPSDEAAEAMREIGDGVTRTYVAGLDEKGKAASELLALLRERVEAVGPVGPGCQP